MNPYPGAEKLWKQCQRCGDYYEIGTACSGENCLSVAQAIARHLGLCDYAYLVVSGYRQQDYTTYACCGRAGKKGTRVAWEPDDGGSYLYHYDLLVEEKNAGYLVYRATYDQGQGSYSYVGLRFSSWVALEAYYRQQYADVDGLTVGVG